MPQLEIFANAASAVIATNGYNGGASTAGAPSSGTTESWTMGTGSTSFPPASNSSNPTTYFYMEDVADTTHELVMVTNVSGTAFSVTRGAGGTTPVTHAAGATWVQAITPLTLQNFKQTPGATTSAVTVSTTTETALAVYSPLAADEIAGTSWEAVAFGSIQKLGGATTATLTWRLRWGWVSSGTPGTAIVTLVSGTGGPALLTTLAAGSSFDVNGTVTMLTTTSLVANLNFWWSPSTGVVSGNQTASNGSGVTVSGSGPLALTAQWSAVTNTESLTCPAPLIYRES